MEHKGILIAASIIVITSMIYIFLETTTITGHVIYEEAPLCENQDDCSPNEACCLFAGEAAGVCYDPAFCDRIAGMTAREYQDYLASSHLETFEEEEEKGYGTTLAATVVLMLGLLIIIYFIALEEKSKQKSFFS